MRSLPDERQVQMRPDGNAVETMPDLHLTHEAQAAAPKTCRNAVLKPVPALEREQMFEGSVRLAKLPGNSRAWAIGIAGKVAQAQIGGAVTQLCPCPLFPMTLKALPEYFQQGL